MINFHQLHKIFILDIACIIPISNSGKILLARNKKTVYWRASMDKKIELKIDKDDDSITLSDVVNKIQEIQEKNPDLDVFFDGDEFAVCSRPKKGGSK
jgi:hypothetical protein